jgi:ArsR family transcriptional regulator
MSTTQLQKMETLFQALGDATRLRILGLLLAGEVCVCDIHDSLKIPQPKASRHLAYLRRAGLVAARREGQWMHYRLEPSSDPLIAAIRQAVGHTLGHVESVRRDAQRLSTRTGCCMPAIDGGMALACCAPDTAEGARER